MNQLRYILPHLYENDVGMNLLLRAPSGWGKTRMSFMICNYLTGGKFDYCLGDKVTITESLRVHFIDEVHLLPHPEVLYPMMDSGKYVFVLATNEVVTLPEALVNRCVDLVFDAYSQSDLREIARMNLRMPLKNSLLDYLIDSGGNNPRVIKSIASRLNIIWTTRPDLFKDMELDAFQYLLKTSFGIENGMDVLSQRYISALSALGGTASLQTISTYMHVDEGTIRFYIEPVLLFKNKIRISSKGRTLC